MAGFPKEQGCYWLSRALVTPPLSLQKKIFPRIEYWQQRMDEDENVHTICGSGFLKLLVQLRTIILQDAVILRQEFPGHELFIYEPFKPEEFNTFADTLLSNIRTTTPPPELEIQRVLPQVHSRIRELNEQLQMVARSRELEDRTRCNPDILRIEEKLDKILTVMESNAGSRQSNGDTGSGLTSLARPRDEDDNVPNEERPAKKQYLSRNISTVRALWTEWTEELDGNLSILKLNQLYVTKWRNNQSEKKYYSNRKLIIDRIHEISASIVAIENMEKELAIEEAVRRVDEMRCYLPTQSLDSLQKKINNENQQRRRQQQQQQHQW